MSTRMVGGVIMTHGDNAGLRLPPRMAPTQAGNLNPSVKSYEPVMIAMQAAGVMVPAFRRSAAGYSCFAGCHGMAACGRGKCPGGFSTDRGMAMCS